MFKQHLKHPENVICQIELSVIKISTNQNIFYLATTDCCALNKYNDLIQTTCKIKGRDGFIGQYNNCPDET